MPGEEDFFGIVYSMVEERPGKNIMKETYLSARHETRPAKEPWLGEAGRCAGRTHSFASRKEPVVRIP
jgi:hypothetical protein